ncbi:MBL fold metallo-hydrolase [bacterium]|nr:MBL fold metallo-hydrolase [bacterium]
METPHFQLHEIAPGVHAAIATGSGAAVSNASIVDLGDKTVVFDTFWTLDAADDLEQVVRELTGRSAFLVVNSHWHSDHVGGNQVFGDVPIVATARTVELILANAPTDRDAYEEEVEGFLTFARRLAAQASTPADEARAAGVLGTAEALDRSRGRFRLTMPNLLFDTTLTVEGSDRAMDLYTYGAGHTDSDTFAHLPEDGVLLMGDLLWADMHPRTNDGHPSAWADTLDRILDLTAPIVVPGHGEVATPEHISAFSEYMRAVDRILSDLIVTGSSRDEIADRPVPEGTEHWGGPNRFHDGLAVLMAR